MKRVCLILMSLMVSSAFSWAAEDYRVLATSKTSTMEKEMNDAAAAGYHFQGVMGGETGVGGNEVAVIMSKSEAAPAKYSYKLLATQKTSTMEKELQEAGLQGFQYRGQTIFKTAFGGEEIVVILEKDGETAPKSGYDYKLLATTKTSTMQKELQEAAAAGFTFVGVTVSKTAFGGKEIVSILRTNVE